MCCKWPEQAVVHSSMPPGGTATQPPFLRASCRNDGVSAIKIGSLRGGSQEQDAKEIGNMDWREDVMTKQAREAWEETRYLLGLCSCSCRIADVSFIRSSI